MYRCGDEGGVEPDAVGGRGPAADTDQLWAAAHRHPRQHGRQERRAGNSLTYFLLPHLSHFASFNLFYHYIARKLKK